MQHHDGVRLELGGELVERHAVVLSFVNDDELRDPLCEVRRDRISERVGEQQHLPLALGESFVMTARPWLPPRNARYRFP
ncbi:MAG: hypothetical protein NVV57_08140 [Demequina sp.]|nr:hypothetical protein [Demequina sp.]